MVFLDHYWASSKSFPIVLDPYTIGPVPVVENTNNTVLVVLNPNTCSNPEHLWTSSNSSGPQHYWLSTNSFRPQTYSTSVQLDQSSSSKPQHYWISFSCSEFYWNWSRSLRHHLPPCGVSRDRRPTWAEERRMNSETFGIPLRHNRGRGFRGGRGYMAPRGGRGRAPSRGSFGGPRSAPPPPGFRGGFRGGRGGRDFSDFEYRVKEASLDRIFPV